VLQLRQNDPSRENAQHQNAKVDANADKVVGVTLRLHAVKIVSDLRHTQY
jgi:hypothetical protein